MEVCDALTWNTFCWFWVLHCTLTSASSPAPAASASAVLPAPQPRISLSHQRASASEQPQIGPSASAECAASVSLGAGAGLWMVAMLLASCRRLRRWWLSLNAGERGCVFGLDTERTSGAMAGVFDIDLDQPDENVSDDELEDGVSFQERRGWVCCCVSLAAASGVGLNPLPCVHYRTCPRVPLSRGVSARLIKAPPASQPSWTAPHHFYFAANATGAFSFSSIITQECKLLDVVASPASFAASVVHNKVWTQCEAPAKHTNTPSSDRAESNGKHM